MVDDNPFALGESVYFFCFVPVAASRLCNMMRLVMVGRSWFMVEIFCILGAGLFVVVDIIICLLTEELVIYHGWKIDRPTPKDPGASEVC